MCAYWCWCERMLTRMFVCLKMHTNTLRYVCIKCKHTFTIENKEYKTSIILSPSSSSDSGSRAVYILFESVDGKQVFILLARTRTLSIACVAHRTNVYCTRAHEHKQTQEQVNVWCETNKRT